MANTLGSVAEGMTGQELDYQAIQLNRYKLAEAPLALAQDQIKLQQDQIELAKQTRMLSLMQNLKPPSDVNSPDAVSGVMSQLSMIQLEAGMPDAAAKTANTASLIAYRSASVDQRAYQTQVSRLTRFANILSTVPDSPQGYAEALHTMMDQDPTVVKDKAFQGLMQRPWQPGMIKQLETSVLSAKDRAEIAYKQKSQEHIDTEEAVDKQRIKLIKAQTALADARADKMKKEGVTPVKAGQLAAITDQAAADFPGADMYDIRVRSRPLAEEMIGMMRRDRLTESEAATRVYQKAKRAGVFSGLRMAPVIPGSKPTKALPLPTASDLEGMKKKLQQNQWYMVQGEPRVYIGSKFYSEDDLAEIDEEDKNETEDEEDQE